MSALLLPGANADDLPTSPAPRGAGPNTEPLFFDCGEGKLFGDWGGIRQQLTDSGVDLCADYIGEVLGNVSGGRDQGAVVSGLLWLNLDLDLEKLGLWSGATVHASGLYPHGDSLTQKYVGDLFTLSNIDARDAVALFELWLEQSFLDNRLSLRLGQLAADQEFATTELGCLFINGTCGWPGFIALNVPSPVYPYGALGARVAFSPNDRWAVRAAVFDGDGNNYDADGQPQNEHGVEYRLGDGALALGEFELHWDAAGSPRPLPGTFKVGGYFHTAEFDDVRLDDTGLPLADPASSGVPRSHDGNWGGYLIAEQYVYREPSDDPEDLQGLGAFFRGGLSPADRNLMSAYLEGGLNYRGLFPGRESDEFGIACVYGQLSDDVRDATRDTNAATGALDSIPDYEMVLESEYRFEVRPGWSVQPGVHYLFHPGGSSALDDALVLSLRTSFCF